MRLDLYDMGRSLGDTGRAAETAESLGFSGLWFAETARSPYLRCAVAVDHTERLEVGTGIAVAFPRSPMVTAQVAWDLQQASGGRFLLGLGTQVKAHVVRRFSSDFSRPVARMRDYIGALRAIWTSFQTGERLAYRGELYSHTLLTEFFDPGPIDHPHIPIYVAGVNPMMARMVGECANGFHVHPFHSRRWLTEVVRPAIAEGCAGAGRSPHAVELACPVFVIIGDRDADIDRQRAGVRRQLGFYGATPAYAPVFELHGFDGAQQQLNAAIRSADRDALESLITDEMLDVYAITSTWDTLAGALVERYGGVVDRLFPYPLTASLLDDRESLEGWRHVAGELSSAPSGGN